MILNVIKILAPATLAFFIGIGITPIVTHYLYKHKMWKKRGVQASTMGDDAPITRKLHNDENNKTPRMGGIIVWGSVFLTILLMLVFSVLDGDIGEKLNFFSRNQTWLPLFTLFVGAVIGLIDDYFAVSEVYDQKAGGLSAKKRLLVVFIVGLIGAWWFYDKLEVTSIIIPFVGNFEMGYFFIPFFILVILGAYSGGVIDGIDGLSGGVFITIFSAYGLIAFMQQQFDIASLSFAIVGGLLAFLWFNIPPARFYLSETGTMALTMTLAVIAFLTEQVVVLPIIAFVLVAASGSSILQILSKKFRNGKKIFLVAPVHHHFEAVGWPSYKVTMRFWIVSAVFSVIGVIIALIG